MFRHLTGPAVALVLAFTATLPAHATTGKLWLDGMRKPTVQPPLKPATKAVSPQLWYTEQLKLHPDQPALYYQLGLLQAADGKLQDARNSFAHAFKLDPKLYAAAWQLAATELKLSHPQAARLVLEPVIASWGVDPDLHYLLGLSYEQLGLKSQALQSFEKVLLLSPGHPAIKYRDALRQELPAQKVSEAAPLLAKADLLLKQKKTDLALQTFKALLLQHPEVKAAYAQIANSQEAMGQFASASGWREQLQSLDACYEDNAGRLGRWLLWTGYFDRATSLLQNQLQCKPNIDAARWLGQLYRQKGNWQMAQSHYQMSLSQWPADAELLSGLASSQMAQGRLAEARTSLAQIKVPGPEALFVRSQLALLSGQAEAALKDLKLAVSLSNRPEYHKALALAYIQTGNGEAARTELTKYLQARPAESIALQALFESIRQMPKRGRFE